MQILSGAKEIQNWRNSLTIRSVGRQYDSRLLHRALVTWQNRLHRLSNLSHNADKVLEHNNAALVEKALTVWKRETHAKVVVKLLRKRQSERVQWQYFQLWQQKT